MRTGSLGFGKWIGFLLLTGIGLGSAVVAVADDQPSPEHHHMHRAALAACTGKAAADACSFTTRKGDTLQGKCVTTEDGTTLACHPDNWPGKKAGN